MQVSVVDTQGTQVGTLEVSDLLFDTPMNTAVVHQAMVRQQANARHGTSNTKTRAQVSGGGIKPRPQKHTGRARQGSIRSPQWAGGGVVFGPHPRSYRQRIPKKMRRLALRCMLSDKAREQRLTVLEAFSVPDAKTREMKQILEALGVTSSSVLLVTPETMESVVVSARNLQRVKTLPAPNLNVLDLLVHDRLVMTVAALRKAEELWAGGPTPGELEPVAAPAPRRRRAARPRTRATEATEAASPEQEPAAETPAPTPAMTEEEPPATEQASPESEGA